MFRRTHFSRIRSLALALTAGVAVLSACDETPLEPPANGADVALLGGSAPDHAAAGAHADRPHDALRVLSRNVFLGADLEPILAATQDPNPLAVPIAVAQAWAQVVANDFPTRAEVLAREISASRPDVVGLQEVALFHTQSPGDAHAGNPQIASSVAFDYLAILLAQLEAHGAHYEVASTVVNVEVEFPALASTSPVSFFDVRYTDRDVVLVREGIEFEEVGIGNYVARIPEPIEIPRGFNRVNVTHEGQTYHVVNTHLETDEIGGGVGAAIQNAQAEQLLGMVAGVPLPTIVVGDLNGRPSGDATVVYSLLSGAGFTDAWSPTPDNPTGFTCCFDKDLEMDPSEDLFERIDYVFVRGGSERSVNVLNSYTVGGGQRYGVVEDSRWPSDHAGVFATVAPASPVLAE